MGVGGGHCQKGDGAAHGGGRGKDGEKAFPRTARRARACAKAARPKMTATARSHFRYGTTFSMAVEKLSCRDAMSPEKMERERGRFRGCRCGKEKKTGGPFELQSGQTLFARGTNLEGVPRILREQKGEA